MDAPARLQLGLLDLRGDLDRVFGGVGVAIAEPRVVVECAPATRLEVTGPDADRAAGVARGSMKKKVKTVTKGQRKR